MAQKFQEYVENRDDVVNMVKLYNEGILQLGVASRLKIIRFLTDYAAKMDQILVKIRVLFAELVQAHQTTPLENILDISIITTELPLLKE